MAAVSDIDKGWRKAVRSIRKRATQVTVGVHGADGARSGQGGISNVRLMAVHEFGKTIQHPGGTPYIFVGGKVRFLHRGAPTRLVTKAHPIVIPERSVIRSTIDEKERAYARMTRKLWGEIAVNEMTATRAANLLGLRVKADMQNKITRGPFEPNKPSTIRRKGSSKPLIDTRQLARALGFEVKAAV